MEEKTITNIYLSPSDILLAFLSTLIIGTLVFWGSQNISRANENAQINESLYQQKNAILQAKEKAQLNDEFLVQSIILKDTFSNKHIKGLVIVENSEKDFDKAIGDQKAYIKLKSSNIQNVTLNDFFQKTKKPVKFEKKFDILINHNLVPENLINRIFEDNEKGWEDFYKKFPDSNGYIKISRVGFNKDQTQAFLYLANQTNILTGTGYYFLLEKQSGSWVIKEQILAWIS